VREFWFGLIGSIFGVIIALALLFVGGAFLASGVIASVVQTDPGARSVALPDRGLVLEVDFRAADPASPGADPAPIIAALRALEAAADDPRIDAVLVLADSQALQPGHAGELSAALHRVSRSQKRVIAHARGDGPSGLYAMLAVAHADEIWAPSLSLIALRGGTPGADDADAVRRIAFEAIAEARGLDRTELARLVQAGPLTAAIARQAGLVDQLGALESARSRALSGAQATLVPVARYVREFTAPGAGPTIALVNLGGAGVRHPGSADAAIAALEDAARSRQVRAILVRVDDPGADLITAERIAAAIRRAQSGGTPVIALTGSGASGPDYLAIAAAERIIAPETARVGRLGEGASGQPATRDHYTAIILALAEARDLPEARIDILARDQVWSGAEAVDFGLADRTGGLHEALAVARDLGGLSPDEPAALVIYPLRPGRLMTILDRITEAD
jgi:ClpP class serine protease